jgi:hypothetical protein
LKNGRWADKSGGDRLKRRIDLNSIARVVLGPTIGYPTRFCLCRDNQGGFSGKYGANKTGRISLGHREMRAIIRKARRKVGFVSSVSFSE